METAAPFVAETPKFWLLPLVFVVNRTVVPSIVTVEADADTPALDPEESITDTAVPPIRLTVEPLVACTPVLLPLPEPVPARVTDPPDMLMLPALASKPWSFPKADPRFMDAPSRIVILPPLRASVAGMPPPPEAITLLEAPCRVRVASDPLAISPLPPPALVRSTIVSVIVAVAVPPALATTLTPIPPPCTVILEFRRLAVAFELTVNPV